MGEVRDIGRDARPDIVCLEGNGARPSHHGDGWSVSGVMFTLNVVEVHCVAYVEDEVDNTGESPKRFQGKDGWRNGPGTDFPDGNRGVAMCRW